MLIGADALAVAARGNLSALVRLERLKAYGFVAADMTLSVRDRLRVEAVFGSPLVPAAMTPQVCVQWAIPSWASPPPATAKLLERKQTAIWGGEARNRFVAAISIAAQAADPGALCDLGLFQFAHELASRRDRPRVAVLVESPEHARHLLRYLTGWRLAQHESRPRRGGWGGWDPAASLSDPDGFDGTILTTMAARRIASVDVDVLIRADGADSPLRLSGFPAGGRDPGRPQILVDLVDDFDETAAKDTRARQRGYREDGWSVANVPRCVVD